MSEIDDVARDEVSAVVRHRAPVNEAILAGRIEGQDYRHLTGREHRGIHGLQLVSLACFAFAAQGENVTSAARAARSCSHTINVVSFDLEHACARRPLWRSAALSAGCSHARAQLR